MSKVYSNIRLFSQIILRAAACPAIALFIFTAAASAATFTVSNTADSGAGSLRQAIADANANADADTIVFASPLFNTAQTIDLTSAELTITQSVTITGRGARLLTVRRSFAAGTPDFGIFNIFNVINVSISGMTISGGNAGFGGVRNGDAALTLNAVAVSGNNSTGTGGGIRHDSGTTTILHSTVSRNTAQFGGGGILVSSGTVNIANSTVSGNSSSNFGGGINNGGNLIMNNVTVTDNRATSGGTNNVGGVLTNFSGTARTRNSIIAGNFATGFGGAPDVRGSFSSNGNNLIGNTSGISNFSGPNDKTNVAANLAPLANNGGQTDTHRPLTGSPAIDAGNNCVVNQSCGIGNTPVPLTTDQRGAGFPRQSGTAVDIGAFEVQQVTTAASVSVSGRVTARGRGISNAVVHLTNQSGEIQTVRTNRLGYYTFKELAVGETYIFNVFSKRYQFDPKVINLTEDLSEIDFAAQ